jgi:hypothetical protein
VIALKIEVDKVIATYDRAVRALPKADQATAPSFENLPSAYQSALLDLGYRGDFGKKRAGLAAAGDWVGLAANLRAAAPAFDNDKQRGIMNRFNDRASMIEGQLRSEGKIK